MLRTLVAGGADIDVRDQYGCTALLYALRGCTLVTRSYKFETAMTLVELGADVNGLHRGRTALDLAQAITEGRFGNTREALIDALLAAGAKTGAEVARAGQNTSDN